MALLQKAIKQQAFLKAGFLGFPGTGKTYTASKLATGIAKMVGEGKPIAFFDTETGSDFLLEHFALDGIEVFRHKSFSFSDLLQVGKEAEASCSVLIVDSISHIWRQLGEDYQKRRKLSRLSFQHWADIKKTWAEWTTFYLNSRLHVIVCGRAGYEWDFEANEEGKKDLVKVGTKMKVESEFGFEPSLLVEMERAERSSKPGAGWVHRAHVLKDRTDTINGCAFSFQRTKGGYKAGGFEPVYKAFLPVLQCLNIGGEHLGVDTSRTSEALFTPQGDDFSWKRQEEQKAIALDEVVELLKKHFPGATEAAKTSRGDILERFANTRSWKRVEALSLEGVFSLRDALWVELEKHPYGNETQQDALTDELPEGMQ